MQTVVRNVCGGSTLVNGQAVSVAALRHGDVISIGGRQLRWDYTRPDARRLQAPQPGQCRHTLYFLLLLPWSRYVKLEFDLFICLRRILLSRYVASGKRAR